MSEEQRARDLWQEVARVEVALCLMPLADGPDPAELNVDLVDLILREYDALTALRGGPAIDLFDGAGRPALTEPSA